jgi:hypothetical protein
MFNVDGLDQGTYKFLATLAGPAEDAETRQAQLDASKKLPQSTQDLDKRILADYFALDPANVGYWNAASADDREQYLESKRGDPYYTMTPDQYAAYIQSQREMSAAQSAAGSSAAVRADIMERAGFGDKKGIPLWMILAAGGGLAFFIFRKKS